MRVYVGQTRSESLIPRLVELGWGEMTTTRDGASFPPRRHPWAYDNGAYSDWTHGRTFKAASFERDIEWITRNEPRPDFIVVPDIVTGGDTSLEFSCAWAPQLVGIAPLYLAIQDGMTLETVGAEMEMFDGIFLGGSLKWKVRDGLMFRALAESLNKPFHVGRCGSINRVRWARQMKADSLDSCLPLWAEANLARFIRVLNEPLAEPAYYFTGDQHIGRRVAKGMGA